MPNPLLVFDTNILMEVLLGRDGASAVLLLDLAEKGDADLVVPEYVLFEFQGTARRWLRDQRPRLDVVRQAANEWERSNRLDGPALEIKAAANKLEAELGALASQIDAVVERIRSVASIPDHTPDLHFRGDIRYLSGLPPDRPVDGIKDCRIYEAVLDIMNADVKRGARPRFVLTRDSDFDDPTLVAELNGLGAEIRKDPGKLYAELRN